MSKEEVSQIFSSTFGGEKPEDMGADALFYRLDAAREEWHQWYYFKEGKLFEIKTIYVEGYGDSWYDEMLIRMKDKFGPSVPGVAPPNLAPIRSDIFGTQASVIILLLSTDMEDCRSDRREDCAVVSEIHLDRSQAGVTVR
jgi:hypothetical protein